MSILSSANFKKDPPWKIFFLSVHAPATSVPIEIPIEAEKIYQHGKELSYRENKMCSETSEAVGTTWEHAQLEFQKGAGAFHSAGQSKGG